MTKETLLQHLRTGEDVIKGIQADQLVLVNNYVKVAYGIVEGSVFMLNDVKVKLHHLSYTEGGRKINLHYQLVKANGKAESTIFTKQLHDNLKIDTNETVS